MNNSLDNFWNDVNSYAQSGFSHINAVQGLLIAIVAAFLMYRWSSVFFVAIGATIVHVLVDVMLPVLANGAPFKLPPLIDNEYWRYLVTLYVGYLIVITVFYVVKRMLVRGEHQLA